MIVEAYHLSCFPDLSIFIAGQTSQKHYKKRSKVSRTSIAKMSGFSQYIPLPSVPTSTSPDTGSEVEERTHHNQIQRL